MYRKFYIGAGVFLILFMSVFVFMMVKTHNENKELKSQMAESQKLVNQKKESNAVKNNPLVARDGFKLVPHGDHYHEVPVDAPDVWKEPTPVKKKKAQKPPMPKHKGPLTYHAELLETNPVTALRLQSEERQHFSAQWIPPFPPSDTEAQEYARSHYLMIYYENKGETDNPKYRAAARDRGDIMRVVHGYPKGPRRYDLMKIGWVRFDVQPYEMYRPNGSRTMPSDYFPKWRSEAEKRLVYQNSGFYDLFMEIDRLEEQGLYPK